MTESCDGHNETNPAHVIRSWPLDADLGDVITEFLVEQVDEHDESEMEKSQDMHDDRLEEGICIFGTHSYCRLKLEDVYESNRSSQTREEEFLTTGNIRFAKCQLILSDEPDMPDPDETE